RDRKGLRRCGAGRARRGPLRRRGLRHTARAMRLKTSYSAREVAALTGLTARQLQTWDATGVFAPAIAPRRTAQGGFTERRYTPVDVLELAALADLRRRGFTPALLRAMMDTLRTCFRRRLAETLDDAGELRLLTPAPAHRRPPLRLPSAARLSARRRASSLPRRPTRPAAHADHRRPPSSPKPVSGRPPPPRRAPPAPVRRGPAAARGPAGRSRPAPGPRRSSPP